MPSSVMTSVYDSLTEMIFEKHFSIPRGFDNLFSLSAGAPGISAQSH
jgi:hypothetical protein